MFKIKRNGDVRADAFSVEAGTIQVKNVIKCPDVYGTDFIVWEALALADIFTSGTSVAPDGTLVYETVNGNSYYDTFTQTIVVADGTDITITNTSEETVTIYVVAMSTLFTALPTKAQLDDMYKLFMMNGTTTELLTIDDIFYVDYTNSVIHNLTTIYGTGNEPATVEAFETLKAKYTNTVIKAKAFENTLQQEYMEISLDTPVYEGLSLRDIFESADIIATGKNLFDLNDMEINTYDATGQPITNVNRSRTANFIPVVAGATYYIKIYGLNNYWGLNGYTNDDFSSWVSRLLNKAPGQNEFQFTVPANVNYLMFNTDETLATVIATVTIQLEQNTVATTYESYLDLDMILATPSLYGTVELVHWETGNLFTTSPTQNQLDEWLDIFLTLTSANSKTGTAFVQDRYYMDYDNAKAYDYNIIAPYVAETPADIQTYMESILAKTITLTGIPVKAKIYKDRLVILGSYVTIGE